MRSIAYKMEEITDDRGEESFSQDLNPEVRLQKFMKGMHDCIKLYILRI